jgi:hypothetical protein
MDWLNPGSVITISDGPACYQGRVYWKVHFKNYLVTGDVSSFEEYDGWIAEMESASNYLLLPCRLVDPAVEDLLRHVLATQWTIKVG